MAFRTGFGTGSAVKPRAERTLIHPPSPSEGHGFIRQLRKGDNKVIEGREINTDLAGQVLGMVVTGGEAYLEHFMHIYM